MAKENTLIHRAQEGDEGAFAALMRSYHAFVCTIVIGIVSNPHDAEEVVQDTFLSAYRGLVQLEDSAKFKSWLAEIARNRARNWLRKQRGDTVSLDEVGEHLLQTEDSPDERLTRQEQSELIRRIMETLPQKDREIARAFYLEGASYNELTSTHGLSDKAISFRLSRARRQLSRRLQYLLTGIFVPPGLTLKKIYSEGLAAMKIGTAPKITVGAAALIALIFIGFVGVREIRAPKVEERVYLSPWEDGTARPRNSPEGLAGQTNSTQDTEVRDNPPQIASAASAAGMESTDDFLGQPEETDTAQFAIEGESEPDIEQSLTTDTSTLLDDNGQSAEDVMNEFVEALRNADFEAIRQLLTADMRRGLPDDSEIPIEIREVRHEVDGVVQATAEEEIRQLEPEMVEFFREALSQSSVVSSEYVDDEFHFLLRMSAPPAPRIPKIPDNGERGVEIVDISVSVTSPPDSLIKMRKEEGVWRVYEGPMLE
jgi:RNA polymerase sigma-70 factor (ECF subfamily)